VRLIDADRLLDRCKFYHLKNGDLAVPIIDVQHAQTVVPERKNGKWIKMSDADGYYYVCDQCGENLPRYMTEPLTFDNPYPPKFSIDKTNFCPNCGSFNGGEDESN